jgi:hypothetical protein
LFVQRSELADADVIRYVVAPTFQQTLTPVHSGITDGPDTSTIVLILHFSLPSWRCWKKCLDNSADTESVSVIDILMRIAELILPFFMTVMSFEFCGYSM